MVVYLDILFFINLIMNYIILIVTSSFGGVHGSKKRIFASAFLGSTYAVVIFLFSIPTNIVFKILFGVFMVFVAFGKKNLLRVCFLFFMVSCTFAGAIIGIFYMSKNPSYMLIQGIPYIEIDIKLLVSTFILCYVSLCLIHKNLAKNKLISDNITEIYIKIDQNTVKVSTFVDSGNALFDIFTKKPIIIVESEVLCSIFPKNLQFVLKDNPIKAIELASTIENNLSLRIINYNSIGNPHGIMTIFKPTQITDKNGKEIHGLIGIVQEKINLAGCNAIIGG